MFRLRAAPFHVELMGRVEGLSGGVRDCVEIPREHAKSTIRSIATPLWTSLTGRKRHTVITVETAAKAKAYLDTIKKRLDDDDRLIGCFGPQGEGHARIYQAGLIELPAGQIISTLGKGQSPRGLLRHGGRPDLLIGDDLQDNESVLSPEQREKDWRWFTQEFLRCGEEGAADFLINGTRLHTECITARLAKLAEDPGTGWTHRQLRATADGSAEGAPLWPEKWGNAALVRARKEMGATGYAKEMDNDPRSSEDAAFRSGWFVWETPPEGLPLELYTFMDPAGGNRKGDYTAVILLAKSRAKQKEPSGDEPNWNPYVGICWCLDAWVERRSLLEGGKKMVEWFQNSNGYPAPKLSAFEDDPLHAIRNNLRQLERDLGAHIRLRGIRRKENKQGRVIAGLQSPIETGRLRFAPKLKGSLLHSQLLDFPTAAHDDGPDALEGAWYVAHRPMPGVG